MKKYLYSLLFIIFILGVLIGLFYFLLRSEMINTSSREEVRLTLKKPVIKKTPERSHKRVITQTNNQKQIANQNNTQKRVIDQNNNQKQVINQNDDQINIKKNQASKIYPKKNGHAKFAKPSQYAYVATDTTSIAVTDTPSTPAAAEPSIVPEKKSVPTGGSVKQTVTVKKEVIKNGSPETYTSPGFSESLLKYVLFSVNYDSVINAGETESLRLTMSPRNKLENLEKAVQEGKIAKNQINDIEKVEQQYQYVSAKLVTRDHCLHIQKIMPEEDKVYLPSVNESPADQVWQWDLTAPLEPTNSTCQLSLFIRFCKNQHDCISTNDPDKEFTIRIHIGFENHIYTWFTRTGNMAGLAVSILSVISIVFALIWRNRRPPP